MKFGFKLDNEKKETDLLNKHNLESKITIKEKPLVDQKLLNVLKSKKELKTKNLHKNIFYPADSAGHKNHKRLILAFQNKKTI